MLTRRNFIEAGAAGLASGACLSMAPLHARPSEIRLVAGTGLVNFSADPKAPTEVMHYNQSVPGPILRIPQCHYRKR